jgi:hypothetical protein
MDERTLKDLKIITKLFLKQYIFPVKNQKINNIDKEIINKYYELLNSLKDKNMNFCMKI